MLSLKPGKSIRLKGYDYAQAGLYFITLCTQDRAHLFGEIKNGNMILNSFGELALKEWLHTADLRDNCQIYNTIVMPNHIHGIIEITFKKGGEKEIGAFKSPSHTIGAIIRGFKIATIKKIKDLIKKGESISNFSESLSDSGEFISSTGELQFAPTAPIEEFAPTAPTEKIKSLNFKIWQRNYYEHIIRNQQAFNRIATYIDQNPKKWDEDKFYKK